MIAPDYTVRLEAFEGPLDLLLYLIRRAEVEITDIPIREITDQYLRYLDRLGARQERGEEAGEERGGASLDIERAAEFLVMAATLMEIKSRMLAPACDSAGEGECEGGENGVEEGGRGRRGDDPRAELVQQLLEYKRLRDATTRLEGYRREWETRYPSAPAARSGEGAERGADARDQPSIADQGPAVEIADLALVDLVEAFARIFESVDFARVGEHRIVIDETPLELHAADIVDRLTQSRAVGGGGGELAFTDLFTARTRSEAIGLFLALLELVRQRRVDVRQTGTRDRLVLALLESDQPEGGADDRAAHSDDALAAPAGSEG